MAQRVNPLSLRLGVNQYWSSEWYSNTQYASLLTEDHLIRKYFKNILEMRGFGFKRALIKRTSSGKTLIFIEVYANPYFKYAIPREYRRIGKYQRRISMTSIRKFLSKLVSGPVYLSITNLFIINRVHRNFFQRLRGEFVRYQKFRFTLGILSVFSIVIRLKGASFLCRTIARELEFIERKKKNKAIWKYIGFLSDLVSSVKHHNQAIHGMRIQLKGRFKGISRPKTMIFQEGMVPFNTIRAPIDYAFAPALSVNGAFGIKLWICYKH